VGSRATKLAAKVASIGAVPRPQRHVNYGVPIPSIPGEPDMLNDKSDTARASVQRDQVQLISKAEAVLDRTLAYQAAQAVHELKVSLGIDISEIRLAVSVVPQSPGAYRVSCAIGLPSDAEPLRLELIVNPADKPS